MYIKTLLLLACLATSLVYAKSDKNKGRTKDKEPLPPGRIYFPIPNLEEPKRPEIPKPIEPPIPEPYQNVQLVLPFHSSGNYHNAVQMEEILRTNSIKVVIELGSQLGTATRHIASMLPKDGVVYAIDPWDESYHQFLSNIIHAHLTDKIIPIKMSCPDAAQLPCFTQKEIVPDLIYINADQTPDAIYAILTAWHPYFQDHTIICGDDWRSEPIREAITKFVSENNLAIETSGYAFWQLARKPLEEFVAPVDLLSSTEALKTLP